MMTKVMPHNFTEAEKGEEIISSVAMTVTLVSFAMLFASLMMGFAMYRFTTPTWPPAGIIRPNLFLPGLSTLFIFLSSLSYIWFQKNISNKKGLYLTLILGIGFLVSQTFFWHDLKTHGILVSSGLFASIIYAFTWVHAAHIVAALGLLVWLILGAINEINAKSLIRVSNVGKFWHFLGIVWLVMFVSIFVL